MVFDDYDKACVAVRLYISPAPLVSVTMLPRHRGFVSVATACMTFLRETNRDGTHRSYMFVPALPILAGLGLGLAVAYHRNSLMPAYHINSLMPASRDSLRWPAALFFLRNSILFPNLILKTQNGPWRRLYTMCNTMLVHAMVVHATHMSCHVISCHMI